MISEYTNRLNVGRSLLEEVAKVLICKETVLLLFCFVLFFLQCSVLPLWKESPQTTMVLKNDRED